MKTFIELLPLIEAIANVAVPILIATLVPVATKVLKSKLDKDQQAALKAGVEAAYWGVEKLARKTDTKLDDKVGEGLKKLSDQLGRDPTYDEINKAKSWWDELHEKRKRGFLPSLESLPGIIGGIVGGTKKKTTRKKA
jgi:hypothetical protein